MVKRWSFFWAELHLHHRMEQLAVAFKGLERALRLAADHYVVAVVEDEQVREFRLKLVDHRWQG